MTEQNGRVLFMGTPVFAVSVLQQLVLNGFHVVAVCTQQDSPVGRKRVMTPPPVKVEALQHGLPVLQPAKVRDAAALAEIESFRPDVIVTCAYGQILPKQLLSIPTVGSVNVHASLLPRWRGAAPIQRAIMAGDRMTGVSIMEMVPALDAGPVYGTKEVPILDTDDYGSLHDKLSSVGASLLCEILPPYLTGALTSVAQPEVGITYANRILREDEWVTWERSSTEIRNHMRALSPQPGAVTMHDGAPVKLWHEAYDEEPDALPTGCQPGTVVLHTNRVFVACQNGWVGIRDVQPSGKRRMAAIDWFRGMKQDALRFEAPERVEKP